jgi:tetratricopeptide (TPR) repeat protein
VGLYELASVQLRKRLYGQAVDNLKLALRKAQAEKAPDEARALIENAYGFALAAESKFPEAIRHYRSALQIKPDYPVALNNLIQFKFEGNGDIYLDNIYFYKNPPASTEPTTAAPTPTYAAANVISVFSDAYTNVAGSNLNPNWGQATQVTEVKVAGNNTLVYSGLNYQGLELGSNQNVSGMTQLHLDFWTANSTELKVSIISPGPAEKAYTLKVPSSGWTSIDIPLKEFTPTVDLSKVFQFKFEGNGKIYLDNILFHK